VTGASLSVPLQYTAEGNTWKNRENLGNAKELVEEFEREYGEEAEELR